MKKLNIVAKAKVKKEAGLFLKADDLRKIVERGLAENIGKEISRILESGAHQGLIKKVIEPDSGRFFDCDVYRIEVTAVDKNELMKLEKEKEKLEKENDELREKIKAYESIGIGEILETIKKVEIATEFANKLQELSGEYCERLG